jgi:beta-glucosidase-like glycosyl hydrolase
MEAGAILPFGDVKARALIAFKAGNDLILASQLNVTEGVEIRQTLAAAIRNRDLDISEFMESTRRIASLKSRTWN